MSKVVAGITTSVDGYVTGPEDGPGCGLGVGFIVTHRTDEQPEGDDFHFVGSIPEAMDAAKNAAGEKDVHVMGGAQTIRECLAGGYVDELTIIVAPVVLGGGKRLFDGFTDSLDLEHVGVRQSPFATFIDYRVKK